MRVSNIVVLLVVFAILGGVYYWVSRPEPDESSPSRFHVWHIEDRDIQYIEISLPRQGLRQSFIKIAEGSEFSWFFDDPERSPVDSDRWGGGVTLLLSGPGADRIISDDAPEEKLAEYGLLQPSMKITLGLTNQDTLVIDVGDPTPNGVNYYIRAPGSNGVATVDYTWYQVLERLVTDPPYASTTE